MQIPKIREDNVWDMLVLEKYETGLPMLVLLADDLMEYGAGVYFYDSYEKEIGDNLDRVLPIDILNIPQVPNNKIKNLTKDDVFKLKHWVLQNQTSLIKLLDGQDYWNIVNDLENYSYDKDYSDLLKGKHLNEGNLRPSETGLKVIVYISSQNSSHGPRVKFQNSYAEIVKTDLFVPLKFGESDEPCIPDEIKKGVKLAIKTQDFDNIKKWVILNKDVLLSLHNKLISETIARKNLKRLGG